MRLKRKRRRVPKQFKDAVASGFDYDSHHNIQENRDQAAEEGYLESGDEMYENLYQDWKAAGAKLAADHAKTQWDIGDWLNHGFELRNLNDGDRHPIYGMAAQVTGLSPQTLKVYAHVARSVNSNIRDHSLNFAQHQLVASLREDKQQRALAGMHHQTVEMSKAWLNLPSTRALLKLDEDRVQPAKPKSSKPVTPNPIDNRNSRAIIRLCDQLLESLSKCRPAAATPAAFWTLKHTVAKAREVLDEVEAASIKTDA